MKIFKLELYFTISYNLKYYFKFKEIINLSCIFISKFIKYFYKNINIVALIFISIYLT